MWRPFRGQGQTIMEGEVSARSGRAEFTRARDLYGLALTVLPSALVLALAQPLLLQPEPSGPEICMLLPSRIPTWWQRPVRRIRFGPSRRVNATAEGAQGMRNSGTSTK